VNKPVGVTYRLVETFTGREISRHRSLKRALAEPERIQKWRSDRNLPELKLHMEVTAKGIWVRYHSKQEALAEWDRRTSRHAYLKGTIEEKDVAPILERKLSQLASSTKRRIPVPKGWKNQRSSGTQSA